MNRLMTFSVAVLAVAALSASAHAQRGCVSPGFGGGYGAGYGGYPSAGFGRQVGGISLQVSGYAPRGYSTQRYAVPRYSTSRYSTQRYSTYGSRSVRPVWHDTTHLDYHAPSVSRYGSRYRVTPGHYDVHRTGHFDFH